MPLFDLSIITGIILESGVDVAKKKLNRQETVVNILKRLNIESAPAADDFEAIYAYTLVEYGVDKPEPVLNFFRHEFIREAFRRSLYENNRAILEKEAEGIIEWNKETGQLGKIDYDPRREFASFSAVFNQIVDNLRSPADVKRDYKIEDIYANTEELIKRMVELNNLNAIREIVRQELAQISQPTPTKEIPPLSSSKKVVRWIHLSDFHVGKDGYGQRKLFKYILDHLHERIASGQAPDMVFITGDIANKGLA